MKLSTENAIFSFCGCHKPCVEVEAPATMTIETKDCFSNQLREPEDTLEQLDWDATNPATGPVYIKGAEPGDTLKVTINKIELDAKGTACCMADEGTLGHMIEGSHVKIIHVENGMAKFSPGIEIPVKPMIGVIGVAPAGGECINTGTPGKHGGNMDNTMVGEGASLYFPVAVEGALFALGDVHAVMGDGEIGVSGLEIPAVIDLTIELIKGKAPEFPFLENQDSWSVIVSEESLDDAVVKAAELMKAFLEDKTDMSVPDIVMLMSLVADMEICQIVDPKKTVRFVMPKKYIL